MKWRPEEGETNEYQARLVCGRTPEGSAEGRQSDEVMA